MKNVRKLLALLAVTGAAVAALVLAGGAAAYGGKSVAQIEVSGNCNNATWCNQNPVGQPFGTGGFWIWASLNNDQDHTVDATFAGCGHTVGGGGPQSAGAGGGPADGNWSVASNLYEAAVTDGAFPLGIAVEQNGDVDPSAPYYVIDLQGFVFAVPEQVGHYNYSGIQFLSGVPTGMKIPGVNFQSQVAP
jgi:hypothetical protein